MSDTDQVIDSIEVGYDAGSVPPPFYERRVTTATPDSIATTVWEGEEAPRTKREPFDAQRFRQLVAALATFGIHSGERPEPGEGEAPPSGGSNRWVVVRAGTDVLVFGDATAGDVAGFTALVESMITP